MAFRQLRKVGNSLRRFTTATGSSLEQEMLEEQQHAAGTARTWKLISFFIAGPSILFCCYNAYKKEQEHHAHGRPEFVQYPHLRIRAKPFPWGDGNHSLFHNSHANALPDGYEEDH